MITETKFYIYKKNSSLYQTNRKKHRYNLHHTKEEEKMGIKRRTYHVSGRNACKYIRNTKRAAKKARNGGKKKIRSGHLRTNWMEKLG